MMLQLRSVDSMLGESPVSTVLDWAQEARMATGLVTTARVTHATPAALYAKTAHRDWEVRPRYYHDDYGGLAGWV